jgi:hypothetical protein
MRSLAQAACHQSCDRKFAGIAPVVVTKNRKISAATRWSSSTSWRTTCATSVLSSFLRR